MKLYHSIWLLYHRTLKRWYKRAGDYQSARFEHHHKKAKRHRERTAYKENEAL